MPLQKINERKNAYIGALVLPNKCAAPGHWALSNVWAARLVDTWPTLDAICSSSSSSSAISSSSSRTSSSSSSSSAPSASSSAQSSDSSAVSSSSSSEIINPPPPPPTSSTAINQSTNSENSGGEDDNNPPVNGSSASGPEASTTSGSGGDNSGGGEDSGGGGGCSNEEACIGTASNLTFVNPDNCNSYNGCVYELTDIDPNTGKQTWVVDQNYCGAGCECVPGEELEDMPPSFFNNNPAGPWFRAMPCQNNGEPIVNASPTFCGGTSVAGSDPRNKTWTSPEGLTVSYNAAWLNPDNGQTEGRWEVKDPNATENGGVLRWSYPYIGTSPDRDPSTIYPWELPGLGLTKVCP